MADVQIPVLIVGGGACGLSAAAFLADAGIESLLVERRDATSNQPKAHYLNQRTMEILRQHGIADRVYERGMPMEKVSVRWCTTMGGDGPLDGRELYRLDGFGGGSLYETYAKDSPCLSSNLPQHRLEPLLREAAEERAATDVRFGHELVEFSQTAEGVRALVRDRAADSTYAVSAEYLIAADGGRTVGPALGIEMEGPSGFLDMVNTVFAADLSEWMEDDVMITWFLNPEGEGSWASGALVPHGPTWGRHSEEWYLVRGVHPDDPERFDDTASVARLRELLRVPDLELEVRQVNHWVVEAVVAKTYRDGRVFLAGDAAHRHPPTTGLGLNTAVQDAHNLAWKLALVLAGASEPDLLATYEQERRPVGLANAAWAMLTFENHLLIDAGMGLYPGQAPAERRTALEALVAETPIGATRRSKFAEVAETQRIEFQAHDVELGFGYDEGAVVADGSPEAVRDPMGLTYTPSGRPGYRLPHVWVTDPEGKRVSTLDLVRPGAFLLLVGPEGHGWIDALAALDGASLEIVPFEVRDGEEAEELERLAGLSPAGAILVRPDGHVAWRDGDPDAEAAIALAQALRAGLRASGSALPAA